MTEPVGPIDPLEVPRFAGRSTFARLPPLEDVGRAEVAVVGIPFDTGTSYRPGARFGPIAIRQASRLLRGYHPGLDVMPFAVQQVADAGDIGVTPFDIPEAIRQIEAGARELLGSASKIITIGGDHTISLPLLRVLREAHGPISLLHFDAHLDTWDTYFGQAYTHGTPFRRAWEEGLLLEDTSMHVGTRGPIFEPQDLVNDERFGFKILSSMDVADAGAADTVERIRARLGTGPVYVSIDVDVMDPAFTPGTGTPEAGGLTSREMLQILRGLLGVNIVGADVVEVSPPYDHAELTAIAASHLVYEFISLFAAARR
jgi:guanidinobutyrase / D-arginase